ncbi:MAG: hypothetical protein HC908_04855 [Calothrix sp. SM1_7_51]|nr:hypothetical protein [Calothrix sp. SM1_7_51]
MSQQQNKQQNNIFSNIFSLRQVRISAVGLFLILGYVGSLSARPVRSSQGNMVPNYSNVVDADKETVRLPEAETLKLASNSSRPATTILIIEPQISDKKATKEISRGRVPDADGVYLFGQVPEAEKIGHGYIVMSKRQDTVTGALYMPNSELSCFQGKLYDSGELAMTVNGYPGEISPTQVASRGTLPVLPQDEPVTYGYSVPLQNYYRLTAITDTARQALQMCQEEVRS